MATEGLIYPYTTPALGATLELAPGVLWVRMPLPFKLDHVNLWALRDTDGWTLVDTGVCTQQAMAVWEQLFDEVLGGQPVTRVICTHRHADHAGLAGWLVERFGCQLWMPQTEYHACNAARLQGREAPARELEFYRRAGWSASALEYFSTHYGGITSMVSPLPQAFRRISDGDVLSIGEHAWQVIVGQGHTAEHACLYCAELDLFISGDQVLPLISSNVSVQASEPDANPLGDWMTSMLRIRDRVSDSVLVLPSHNACFAGLHTRINDLVQTQQYLLRQLQAQLSEPRRSVDIFKCLFGRDIGMDDGIVLALATGESRANLNWLIAQGCVEQQYDAAGVEWYRAR
ncbi:MBL fold metallo-hydrolase [Halopseudomonas sp.]|uniref:MBL fold metallo-hydrolase n=1 Tax=Halopseudomonas sp. TaxID=2901191 RepID=UPI003002F328